MHRWRIARVTGSLLVIATLVAACGGHGHRLETDLAPGGTPEAPTEVVAVDVQDHSGNDKAAHVDPVSGARVELAVDGGTPTRIPATGGGLYQREMRLGGGTFTVAVDGKQLLAGTLPPPITVTATPAPDGKSMTIAWSPDDQAVDVRYFAGDEAGSGSVDSPVTIELRGRKRYHFLVVHDIDRTAAGLGRRVELSSVVGFDYTGR